MEHLAAVFSKILWGPRALFAERTQPREDCWKTCRSRGAGRANLGPLGEPSLGVAAILGHLWALQGGLFGAAPHRGSPWAGSGFLLARS